MKTRFTFALLAALTLSTAALAEFKIRGEYETQYAVELEDAGTQKFEHILKPEFESNLTDDIRLFGLIRIRYDMTDHLEPGEPRDENVRSGFSRRFFFSDNVEAELRELYIDGDIGEIFFRLGKQQVVWGQADGLRVLDVVNPFNFREFILPEFEDYRIPLWTANVEVPISDWTAQFLWIPDQTYDQVPGRGSNAIFEFTSPLIVPQASSGTQVTLNGPITPNRLFADSDAGVRLSTFKGGWDLTLNYLYHYHDSQVLRRTINGNSVTVTPEYERTHLIGGTFSNAFGDISLRGEVGYSTNRFFITDDVTDADGVVESGNLGTVIGLDYGGIRDVFLSGQIFANYIDNFQDGITRDEIETQMTFRYVHEFMNDTLKTTLSVLQSLNNGDGLIQAHIKYQYSSNITLNAGADIFYGKDEGLFGQFQNNDRVTLGMKIGF